MNSGRKLGHWIFFLVLAAATFSNGPAQSGTTGTLSGIVKDSTGAVLPGVEIQVRGVGYRFEN